MQDVFLGKADCTKHLMGDTRTFRCRFAAADFGRSRLKKRGFIPTIALRNRLGGRSRHCERSCSLSSETRDILLKTPARS